MDKSFNGSWFKLLSKWGTKHILVTDVAHISILCCGGLFYSLEVLGLRGHLVEIVESS